MTVSNRPIVGYRKQGDVHVKLCRNAMSSTFCGNDRNLHLGDIAQGARRREVSQCGPGIFTAETITI